MVVAQTFHEIARKELHVIEFREVENMRFRQNGSGNIQFVTNLGEVIEKMRIRQFFGVFVYVLLAYPAARHQFCPNSHTRIIHETPEKVNCLQGSNADFSSAYSSVYSSAPPHKINHVRAAPPKPRTKWSVSTKKYV